MEAEIHRANVEGVAGRPSIVEAHGSGYPAPLCGEFEVVIMIEGVTEEMHGSN